MKALPGRSIRFARRPDSERVAFTVVGSGPLIVRCPGQNSHLELMWGSPLYRESIEGLAKHHTVVLYDRHGCGLSDRNRSDFSIQDDVVDLLTVMGFIGIERAPVIGTSSTGPIAVAFAANHPQRVSRLVLYGAMACLGRYPGFQTTTGIRAIAKTNPALAYRVQTERLFPLGTGEEVLEVFRTLRESSTQEVLEGLAQQMLACDVTEEAHRVSCPTLVLHRRDDQAADFQAGMDLASLIPGARFVPLEGNVHLDMGDDWLSEVLEFLAEDSAGDGAQQSQLSKRETEIVRLLAAGKTNAQIADDLVISPATVAKHVTSILSKTGSANRAQAAVFAHEHGLV